MNKADVKLMMDTLYYRMNHNPDMREPLKGIISRLGRWAKDARLGAAVRGMPTDRAIAVGEEDWFAVAYGWNGDLVMGEGSTPEAALKAAGLMDDENDS